VNIRPVIVAIISTVILFQSIAEAQQQSWPPGQYCAVMNSGHMGLEVLPPNGDGITHTLLNQVVDRADLGIGREHSYNASFNNRPFEGRQGSDGTINLTTKVNGNVYSGMRYDNGHITGIWISVNGDRLPANFGSCSSFADQAKALLFRRPSPH